MISLIKFSHSCENCSIIRRSCLAFSSTRRFPIFNCGSNTYTDGLPIPAGTVSWAALDTEHENCSINLVDISETDYNDYMELLKQEGFSVIEDTSEEIKGQDYVSVGTLLSNGEKGLGISYIPNSFTIYISFVK